MSRTQKSKNTTNPATMFIEWASDEKTWRSYDKDKKENVLLPMSTPFIMLDQLTTVAGFCDRDNSSYYGSEVRDIKSNIKVFCGGKQIEDAPWASIKEKVLGIKFAKAVYALAKINGEYQLVSFKMSGCALSWFDAVEKIGLAKLEGDTAVAVTSTEYGKKGKVEYNTPQFTVVATELSDEAAEQADAADEALQEYLKEYLKGSVDEADDDTSDEDAEREREMEEGSAPPPFDPADDDELDEDVPF